MTPTRPLLLRSTVTLALLFVHAACAPANDAESSSPPASQPSSQPSGPDASAPASLDVRWSPCTLDTQAKEAAECATVKVPYRWDTPDGRTVDVFLKHYRAPGVTSNGQVWLLQGGPGAWAQAMDGVGSYLTKLGVGMDYYSIDQRGTGRSSRLGCKIQESAASPGGTTITDEEWPDCIAAMKAEWSPSLEGFTVTNTAHDLGALIDTLRGPDQRVFVYGVSYGTYLANRYLELYPTQATGVILDSIAGPHESFTTSDAEFDAVMHDYFDACGADATCSSRLGADPWQFTRDLLTRLDAGHCAAATSAGFTRATLRHFFASLAYGWDTRILIPAFLHRLDRCGAQDVAIFERLGPLLAAPTPEADLPAFSIPLAYHVGLSELWEEPSPAVASLLTAEDDELVCNGVAARMAAVHDIWPRAPHDSYYGAWAKTDTPLLMLGGTLDPATPYHLAVEAKTAFAGPHQTFVTVPRASHCVFANSPVSAAGVVGCGVSLVVQFLDDPTATLDTRCTEKVQPLSFDHAASAQDYFGTSDLWGD